jgi:membrane-bound lytic murein transglycosylase
MKSLEQAKATASQATATSTTTQELQISNKQDLKKVIYPFVDEMVDTLYTDECNNLIENAVSTNGDKSVFLMFVMMYFGIHLKLDNQNDATKKEQIKSMLSDVIRDPHKRKLCIEMFQNKVQDIFNFDSDKDKLLK